MTIYTMNAEEAEKHLQELLAQRLLDESKLEELKEKHEVELDELKEKHKEKEDRREESQEMVDDTLWYILDLIDRSPVKDSEIIELVYSELKKLCLDR